jgi:DnaK suppressor protein
MAKKVTKKNPKAASLTKVSPPKVKAKPQASKLSKAPTAASKPKPSPKSVKASKLSQPAKSIKITKPAPASKNKTVTAPKAITVKAVKEAPEVEKAPKVKKPAKQAERPPAVTSHNGSRKFPKPPFPIRGPKPSFIPETPLILPGAKKQTLNKKFLDQQKQKILELRDHLLDQMQGVAQDNLRARDEGGSSSAFGMHQADAGSDAYEKDFALSLLSQEQDALYEIEEALKRIELGGYGLCEMSGKPIPIARLEAIPFARYTREFQEQAEKEAKGKNRWETAAQFMDSTDNFFEEEEEGDEEEKPKLKE